MSRTVAKWLLPLSLCLGGAAGADDSHAGRNPNAAPKKEKLQKLADDSPHLLLPFDPMEVSRRTVDLSASTNTDCPMREGFTWHASAGSNQADIGWAVAASCEGVYEVGYTAGTLPNQPNVNKGSNDFYIKKMKKDGSIAWTVQDGTPGSDNATAVLVSSSCAAPSIYVTGYTSGSLAGTSAGGSDLFLMKLNAQGNEVWRRQLGTAQVEQALAMAQDAAGNLYVVGSTGGNLEGAPAPTPPSGTTSFFVVKYNSDGGVVWKRQRWVANKALIARSVSVGADGFLYIAGSTTAGFDSQAFKGGSHDAFVAKYDTQGTWLKTALLGTSNQDQAFGIATGVQNGQTFAFVTGQTNGSFPPALNDAPNYDLFIARLDGNLNLNWLSQEGIEGTGQNVAANAIVFKDGNVFVTGATPRNLDTNEALGSSDMFLLQYKADGTRLGVEYLGTNVNETAQGLAADPDGNLYVAGRKDGSYCGDLFAGGGFDSLSLQLLDGCEVLGANPNKPCYVGGGWGDPHYFSFDQFAFDFQSAGDFVLATVQGDPSLEVQVRQCPWSPGAHVSTVRAVGMKIGSDVVEYQANGDLYINGVQRTQPIIRPVSLPGGGAVYLNGAGTYVFAWPKGDRLVAPTWGSGMNIYLISPSAKRRGKMLGLLGNADGDRDNEFLMSRDGTEVRAGLSFLEMYKDAQSYANVWRVQPNETSFITHGTDCTDFVTPSIPTGVHTLTPAERAQGELACAAITDPLARENCIMDVGVTGDPVFVQAAVDVNAQRAQQGQTAPLVRGPRSVYFNNFAGQIGAEWSAIAQGVTPLGDRTFLGEFGNENVLLSLNNLGNHTELTLSFDLLIINGWDGDGPFGPNTWKAVVDGQEVANYTFSNTFSMQSYPSFGSMPGSGALEANTLFYPQGDSVYRIKLTFPHTASNVTLDLSAEGLPGLFGEKWGVTNFEVQGR